MRLLPFFCGACAIVGCATVLGVGDFQGHPVECQAASDCPAPAHACTTATCDGGRCGSTPSAAGNPCAENGGSVCDGGGACVRADGAACAMDGDCLSSHCAEVCCDKACAGPCKSCKSIAPGKCLPLPPLSTLPACAGACNASGICATGAPLAAFRWGDGTGDQSVLYVSHHPAKPRLALTGIFAKSISFGGAPLYEAMGVTPDTFDMFIAVIDESGNEVWSRSIGSKGLDFAWTSAWDPDGNLVVAGWFTGTIAVGNVPHQTSGDRQWLVVKFDGETGTPLWSVDFGGALDDEAIGLAIDAAGDIAVTGTMVGAAKLGGIQMQGDGSKDLVLVVLDPKGSVSWFTRIADDLKMVDQAGRQVTFDPAGNLVVVGQVAGTVTLAGQTHPGGTGLDWFVASYAPMPNGYGLSWWHAYSGAGADLAVTVSTNASGDILVGGYGSQINFGNGPVGTKGGSDAYAALFSSSGKLKRVFSAGDGVNFHAVTVAELSPEGDWLLAGQLSGSMTVGKKMLISNGQNDWFVARLDANGSPLHVHNYGDGADQFLNAGKRDADGGLWLGGTIQGVLQLDATHAIASIGQSDAALVHVAP